MKPTVIDLAQQKRNVYYYTAPEGTPVEVYLKPETWVHVGGRLSPMDRMEIFAEDGKYFAELICLNAGPQWAHMHLLRCVSLVDPEPDEKPTDFEVKYGGPARRYGVRRLSDNEWLIRDCQTHEEAAAWLANHRAAMGL